MLGRPAGERRRLIDLLDALLIEDVRMDMPFFRRCLEEHPRLVMAVTHGGVISWIPFAVAMIRATMAIDPERPIVATGHPLIWKVPGLHGVIARLAGSDGPLAFPELLAGITSQPKIDYYALPESEHCLYGDLGEVKPFRFHGFIEIAARAKVPILIVAQRGSEGWYRAVDMSGLLGKLVAEAPPRAFARLELNKAAVLEHLATYRFFNAPLPHRPIRLGLAFEMYRSEQLEAGLAEDFRARRRQLAAEGERIRGRMQALYESMGDWNLG